MIFISTLVFSAVSFAQDNLHAELPESIGSDCFATADVFPGVDGNPCLRQPTGKNCARYTNLGAHCRALHDDPELRPALEHWAKAYKLASDEAWFMRDKRYAGAARSAKVQSELNELKSRVGLGPPQVELPATIPESVPPAADLKPSAPKMMTPAQVEAMYKDFSAAQLPPGARVNFKDWAIPAGSKCANNRTATVGDVQVECSPCVDHGDPGVTHLGSYELESVSTWRAYYAVNLGYKLRLGGGEQAITLSCGPESAMSTTPALIKALAAFGITMDFPFTKAAELRQAPAPATTAF